MFEGTDYSGLSSQLNPVQFARAFFDSAVQTRYNAVAQLAETANLSLPKMHLVNNIDRKSLAAAAGSIVGEAVDMMLLSRITGAAGRAAFDESFLHKSSLGSAAHLGITGTIYGGVFTPTTGAKEPWKERLDNAMSDGLSFTAMGAAEHRLAQKPMFAFRPIANSLAVGALSGAVGGATEAQTCSLLDGNGFASLTQTALESAQFAAFGAAFVGAGRTMDKAFERAGKRAEFPASVQETTKSGSDGLTVSKLEAAFGEPLVRVRLRWDLLKKLDSPVSTHVVTDQAALSNFYHPWYRDPAGKIVGWDSADARPLSVSDVADKPSSITAERLKHIQETGKFLGTFDGPVQITALGYRLPGDKHFLLDSNHRIAAVAATGLPFRLIVHSINGPVNGEFLPDLVQFDTAANDSLVARAQAIRKVQEQNGWR